MSLFHRVRNTVNELLAPSGIAIDRTEKRSWKWLNRTAITRVGQYFIEVPGISPMASHYTRHPNWSSQLGRLASIIRKKYPAMAAIDVGANVGDTACIIKSGEDIPLLCIEGDEFTFRFLQKNIAQFKNTTGHQFFLGEKKGVIFVDKEKAGWNLTLIPGTTASASNIELTTLDDFLASRPDRASFKLLKIDTEGFDCSIIRGAMNYIRSASPVITFEYNRENMDAIGEPGLPTLFTLQAAGYSGVAFHDLAGRFLLSAKLEDRPLIKDLHDYADCVQGIIGYLDITVFHANDNDLAEAFVELERSRRSN
jgi:FkbM family methyltransferase